MPLPRRRSSFLGQATEQPGSLGRVSVGSATAPRGVFVGTAPSAGTNYLSARVSRRALGISSVFLQGLRSISAPLLPQYAYRGELGPESLNSCLLEYREKVCALEQLNQQLEEQIRNWLEHKASTAETWDTLRHEWENAYRQVSEAILDNARLMLQTENVQASVEDLKDRFENEKPFRKEMQEEIDSLYKVIDDATLTKMDLENQIESMKAELLDLARNHEEDVRLLYNQLAGREVDEPDTPIETSLDQILDYIRCHWEKIIKKTRAETDTYMEIKVDSMNSKRSQEEIELEDLKTECNNANVKIQSLQAETESMRALKRGLENSLNDAKHWHGIELQNLGSLIGKLEAELRDVQGDIEQQQHDYETLLNNKKRLEMEIGMYHGILDGFPDCTAESTGGSEAQPSLSEQQSTLQAGGAATTESKEPVFRYQFQPHARMFLLDVETLQWSGSGLPVFRYQFQPHARMFLLDMETLQWNGSGLLMDY